MRWHMTITGVSVLTLSSIAHGQAGVLDQESPWEDLSPPAQTAGFNLDASSLTWQAQIRAGMDGTLEGITIGLNGSIGSEIEMRIRMGPAWSFQSPLFVGTVVKSTVEWENVFTDMTAAGITLSAGDILVMEVQGNNTGGGMLGSYVAPANGSPLYDEPLYLNQNNFADGGWRLGFKTYMVSDCAADFNGDGIVNTLDFLAFLNAYNAGDPAADFNGDGIINTLDFLAFLNAFNTGC